MSYFQPLRMRNKWLDTHPSDVVWDNLDDGAFEMTSRFVLSWVLTIGLILVWGFPVVSTTTSFSLFSANFRLSLAL
jgi:calcium permeable stress-gated cation channel